LQHSKTPWKHVTEAIKKLDNKGIKSYIKDLEALQQEYKYSSEEFCLKVADLVVNTTNVC
jgi:spore germination protein YaaH